MRLEGADFRFLEVVSDFFADVLLAAERSERLVVFGFVGFLPLAFEVLVGLRELAALICFAFEDLREFALWVVCFFCEVVFFVDAFLVVVFCLTGPFRFAVDFFFAVPFAEFFLGALTGFLLG